MIERAEVFVVGPETERYVWAEGMSEQFMANIVLKLGGARSKILSYASTPGLAGARRAGAGIMSALREWEGCAFRLPPCAAAA